VARRLQADFAFKDRLGVQGFPTLVAEINERFYALTIGYAPAEVILTRAEKMLEREQSLQASN
jgi:protein-disulfide isomerase-like protein with CxxC motif